jgi:hypothetical protein
VWEELVGLHHRFYHIERPFLLLAAAQVVDFFVTSRLDIGNASDVIVDVAKKKTTVSCIDGTACDLDGACNYSCKFHVGACINLDETEGCTPPGTLEKTSAKGKVKGVKGASGKVVIDASQLLQGSVCGAYVDVVIPLKSNKKGYKPNKAKLKLQAKAPKGTKPRKDTDKFELVCVPNESGCGSPSGAFIDR